MYGPFEPFCDPMALSIMVKFTKPGRLIAQTSYLGRFKPLKKFGKSFLKSVKVYRRILDLAHCAIMGLGALMGLVALMALVVLINLASSTRNTLPHSIAADATFLFTVQSIQR